MIVQSDLDAGGGCSYPIALCNALEFWGLPHPEPGTPMWEVLIDLSSCRHGRGKIEQFLGVVTLLRDRESLSEQRDFPLVVAVHDPKLGLGYHSILVTARDTDNDLYAVVNFEGEPQRWVAEVVIEIAKASKPPSIAWVVPQYHLLRKVGRP